ncbi:MAG: FimV/HubP family polar landmark protein, partial [Colwellia sp.]
DIDDLLDEVMNDVDAAVEENAEEAAEKVSSPDDIDDLLDEVMSDVDAAVEENVEDNAEEAAEEVSKEAAEEATEEVTPQDNIDEANDAEQTDPATQVQSVINKEKISNFSDEYIEPFLDVNFNEEQALEDIDSTNDETSEVNSQGVTEESEELQNLDDIDFDDLLASIEDETPQTDSSEVEAPANEKVENVIEEQSTLDTEDSLDASSSKEQEREFVSVESLLSQTEDEEEEEPYKESNIDVGLGDFPDMTKGINKIDVDQDSSIAAKLDLAKVYIEIGDDEHAQILLDEVVLKGEEEQVVEAKKLLNELS